MSAVKLISGGGGGVILSPASTATDITVTVPATASTLLTRADGASNATYTPAGTGAVATTVQAKLRESVSVKDFGAVGDGVTDDTAAIQAACTAALNVFFPSGSYLVSSGITLQAGASIFGDNPINTFVNFSGTGALFTCTVGEYTSVKDISLYGTKTAPAYFRVGTVGIELNDSISMYNVHIRHFEIALDYGTSGFYNKFFNCQFAYNKYAAKDVAANNLSFFGCRFLASDYFVTLGGYDSPVLFSGCSFENVTQSIVSPSLGASVEVTFNGCYVENAPTTSVVGTGLNAAGFTAAMIAYGDFKAISLFGCGIQIMGFQRGVSVTNTDAVVSGSGNIWYYKLDGGLSDTQYLYVGGKKISVFDRSEAWSVPSYVPAVTYTIIGLSTGSATDIRGFDPISSESSDLFSKGIRFPATANLSTDANTLDDYREGTFTFTATGMTTSQTGSATYAKAGNLVTLAFPFITGTSNATTFTLTGLPAVLTPSATRAVLVITRDNSGVEQVANCQITSGGLVNLFKDVANTAFTAAGVKSINALSVTYTI